MAQKRYSTKFDVARRCRPPWGESTEMSAPLQRGFGVVPKPTAVMRVSCCREEKMAELEIDLNNPAHFAYWKVNFYKRLWHMICFFED